jgi:hypothetical protein
MQLAVACLVNSEGRTLHALIEVGDGHAHCQRVLFGQS